jgi:hypothetical protein
MADYSSSEIYFRFSFPIFFVDVARIHFTLPMLPTRPLDKKCASWMNDPGFGFL